LRILLTILVTMIAIIIMHELNKRLSPLIKNERENFWKDYKTSSFKNLKTVNIM